MPAADPAQLLYDARMRAGLTQSEVAHRSGLPRQTVSAYERGLRHPTIKSLDRLLTGCGMRLRLVMVPEAGLEDQATLDLLALPALNRLSDGLQVAVTGLAEASPEADEFLITGRVAARLHGAVVEAPELEILVNGNRPAGEIAGLLASAGVADLSSEGATSPLVLTNDQLRQGCTLHLDVPDHGVVPIEVLVADDYQAVRGRAIRVELLDDWWLAIASDSDCAAAWHPRDLDHLALQRAWRLAHTIDCAGGSDH